MPPPPPPPPSAPPPPKVTAPAGVKKSGGGGGGAGRGALLTSIHKGAKLKIGVHHNLLVEVSDSILFLVYSYQKNI